MLRRIAFPVSLAIACALPAAAQQTRAYFDAPVVAIDEFHRFDLLLDFDGDGYEDAVGWWCSTFSRSVLTAWRNDQSGGFVEVWGIRNDSHSSCNSRTSISLAAGDLNGDGLDDLVVVYSASVHCYLSDGTTPFVEWRNWPQIGAQSPVIEDFDGDGLGDLAFHDDRDGLVCIFYNRGPELPFEEASVITNYGIDNLSAVELNGDGLPDLVAWPWPVLPFPIVNGVPVQGTPIYVRNNGALAIGDVDGDDDQDMVHFNDVGYSILRRTGPEEFTVELSHPGGPATKLADVDGDGDLDGVCCGGGGGDGLSRNSSPAVFEISINQGSGDFAPAFRMPSVGSIRIAGAADLDHDGDVDLVGGRCVYYARGPLVNPYPTIGAEVVPAAFGDCDSDGDPDWEFGIGSVWNNRGDGTFASTLPQAPAPPSGSTFTGPGISGDFDSDGDVDLLVERRVGTTFAAMRLLRNAGGGLLTDAGDAGPPGYRFTDPNEGRLTAVVADVDGDGDNDLCARTFFGGSPREGKLWLNDGTEYFVDGQQFVSEYVVHVARMDGDALPDLVTNDVSGNVRIRRGLGNGFFGSSEWVFDSPLDTYRSSTIQVVDFDEDGDLDIIGAAISWGRIYANDGAAGFSSAAAFTHADGRLFAVDVDMDDRLDIVFCRAFQGRNSSVVYRRSGPGFTFEPPVFQAFLGSALADVDGDGDLDFLSDAFNSSNDNLDITSDHFILNRRFEGTNAGWRQQYGPSLAGSGGVAPVLGADGPFRPYEPHAIRLTGGLGGARAILAVGTTRENFARRGGIVLVGSPDPLRRYSLQLGGPAGAFGAGSRIVTRAFTPASFAGRTFTLQAFVVDPGAPQRLAFSNGLELRFGY